MRTNIEFLYARSGRFFLPVFVFAFSILPQIGCSKSASPDEQADEPIPAQAAAPHRDKLTLPKVFADLPLSFNGALKVELKDAVPLEPNDKPGGEGPQRVHLTIEGGYADQVRDSAFSPGIAVYDVEEFREVLATQPRTLDGFKKRLESLRSLLNEKQLPNVQDEIEIVRYIEPEQVLRAHSKFVTFKEGYAIAYLTQFQPDAGYITNCALTYVVQGLTADGKYYLFGTFPVRVDFLPDDSDIEDFEGYKIPAFTPDESEALEHSRYLKRIEKRLEETSPQKFQPDLGEIDKLISSIEIRSE